MVTALTLAGCKSVAPVQTTGTTVTGKTTSVPGTTTSTPTTIPPDITKPIAVSGQPKYGGTITIRWGSDPSDFDQGYKSAWYSYTLDATNDTLSVPDWKKGPLGTNEIPFRMMNDIPSDLRTGISTWSLPDPQTIVFKIKPGLHFLNKPPVNGRELVADDVVTSVNRLFSEPGAWLYAYANKPVSVTATDKYTVTFKFASFDPSLLHNRISETGFIVPRELVKGADGKENGLLRDWHNANGTGAFMLKDYVSGSSILLVKNPDYWETDPLHTGNKLPYVDEVKVLIIPDLNTALSALRAGKIDQMSGITLQDALSLKKTSPELKNGTYLSNSVYAAWPNDQIAPFNDIRVRRALSMAIDRDQLIKDLYSGIGEKLALFVYPSQSKAYTPFDQLPAETKANYNYNPDAAKKLLADAGYTTGIKTQICIDVADPTLQDLSAQLKGYWDKIGVQVTIDAQAFATYNNIRYSKTYNGMILSGWANAAALWNNFDIFRGDHYSNWCNVKDSYWDTQIGKVAATLDENTRYQMVKDLNVYCLNQVWAIITPTMALNVFWQPWFKGVEGIFYMGIYHYFKPFSYAWIDKTP
jgi:peptide/nickel transport system substrate-binding protein